MTYIELLCEGVKTIAKNHHSECNTDDWETESCVVLWNCCGLNVPTAMDCNLLAQECWLVSAFETDKYGATFWISQEWYEEYGKKEFVPNPVVNGMWCRADQFTDIFKREVEL